ncbi:MAG: HAMP domain-containing histidine kinase [Sphingomonas bacterium]|nr:HAMP domain-containing histidine kinase [Sphingomonas bacterium]
MGEISIGPLASLHPSRPALHDGSIEDEARLIIFNPWVMLAGQSGFFSVVCLIYFYFIPVVPATPMFVWRTIVLSLFTFVCLFDLAYFILRRRKSRLFHLWHRADKWVTVFFDIVGVGVIWLLLPYGDEAHRIIIVAFCVGYVPLQMISNPENTLGNRISVVAVLGSFAIFLMRQDQIALKILSVMVVLYGAVLYFCAEKFRTIVTTSLASQREIELANRNLFVALNEVSASRDAKTRFIAAASHDLGQPIQAASLFAEQAIEATDAAAKSQALTKVAKAVQSAQAMLTHMLYSMRLEADAVTPMKRGVELATVLHGLAAQYAFQAVQNGMTLDVTATAAMIDTDPILLERAIGNLLNNAIAHSGGTRVWISAKQQNNRMLISIADDGVGIAAEDCASLFDDYSQGSNSRSTTRGGFGLGLASVRRIATLLGGEIRLVSPAETGAEFVLDLPQS